jgi:nitrite reductase/ring-hydroxylating ferredoxin subunit
MSHHAPDADHPSTSSGQADCSGCPLTGRREFLRDALAATAAVFATLAIPGSASALPLSFTRAIASRGTQHSYTIPSADGVQIDRDNEVILTRWQNAIYAFALSCPHQNTALRWDAPNSRFQCPKHKSKYEPDGTFISGRATRSMDRFALHREGAAVIVDLDALYQADDNPKEWAAAVVKL